MQCPYCDGQGIYTDSKIVYGQSYGMIYLCSNYPKCDAMVGVHRGTSTPLGRMANAELRYWKKKAHEAFDQIWRSNPNKTHRTGAYKYLQEVMEMSASEAHIGNFNIEQCRLLIQKLNSNKTMTQVTITQVYRSDKDKNGNALVGKSGRPYSKCSIKCQEYGDKWLGGFGGAWNQNWKVGDTVTLEVKQNGQYLNFEQVDETKVQADRIEKKLDIILEYIKANKSSDQPRRSSFEESLMEDKPSLPPIDEEISLEDIPF